VHVLDYYVYKGGKGKNNYLIIMKKELLWMYFCLFGFITYSYGQLNFSSAPKTTAAIGESYGGAIEVNDPTAVLSYPVLPDWLKFEDSGTFEPHDYGPLSISEHGEITGDKDGNVYFQWWDPELGLGSGNSDVYIAKISRDQSVDYRWRKIEGKWIARSFCVLNDYIYGLFDVYGSSGPNCIVRFSISRPQQPAELVYIVNRVGGQSGWAISASKAGNDKHIYLSSRQHRNVIKINPETGEGVDHCPKGSMPGNLAGIAVASDGSVYVQSYTTGYAIMKIPPGGGSPVQFSSRWHGLGLFIDSKDNLYATQVYSGNITKTDLKKSPVSWSNHLLPQNSINRIVGLTEIDGFLVYGDWGLKNASHKMIRMNAILVGTPTTAGIFPVKVTATSRDGKTSKDLEYNIVVKDLSKLSDFQDITGKLGDVIKLPTPISNSPAAFSYSSNDTSIAVIDGNQLTFIGNGTAVITAAQEGTEDYFKNSISCRAISRLAADEIDKTYGDAPFLLPVKSLNEAPVSLYVGSNNGVATIDNITGEVTIVGAGSVTFYCYKFGDKPETVVATVNVKKADLVITADNKSKNYGAANPVLTISYTGFVNGDTQVGLTRAATITTTANDSSPAGNYPIVVSNGESDKYDLIYENGILTIIDSSLGTDKFNKGNFSYYPNPVKDKLYVSLDQEIDNITVISFTGQIVLEKPIHANQFDIDLSVFASGLYFVKLSTGKQSKIIKVTKN
jgi:hypothetical protein